MASDLEADLRDAAADHVAPEEVLGNGVFDAPLFARSWAAARGVIPTAPRAPVARSDGRRVVAVALAALAVLAAGLLTLVIFHPFARAVAVRRATFVGPGPGVIRACSCALASSSATQQASEPQPGSSPSVC